MKKSEKKKSDFQKEIEEQQKRLEELYAQVLKYRKPRKELEVPRRFKELFA